MYNQIAQKFDSNTKKLKVDSVPLEPVMTNTIKLIQLRNIKNIHESRSNVDYI